MQALFLINVLSDSPTVQANSKSFCCPCVVAAMAQSKSRLAFQKLCFAGAQLHMDLAQHFKDEEKPLFQDIPKIHPVLHSALASGYINPRLTWCFRQEDNMNVHRTLAKSRCKGLQGPLVTAKMVAKLRIACPSLGCKVCILGLLPAQNSRPQPWMQRVHSGPFACPKFKAQTLDAKFAF